MAPSIRLMLTGGGTGGHLFPAIATAEALGARCPGSQVLFVGTRRRMDKTSLEQYGYATCSIHSEGLKGKDLLAMIRGLALLPLSCLEAMIHILRFRPDLVLGVGGYVTAPVLVAAWILRIPTLIHEQNSVPGLANRKVSSLVTRICLSLPGSEKCFPPEKTVLTGNPVRRALLDLSKEDDTGEGGVPTLLVLGGSLGAHRVNDLVTSAFALGILGLKGVRVIHQTGPADAQEVEARYRRYGIEARVAPFFTDMAAIYREADFLVSRAGATTLAELAVLGKPALLIPYPHAADNHQQKNAQYYVEGGGAVMYIEKELTPELLGTELAGLMKDCGRLKIMGAAMQTLAFPRAAEQIVDECLDVLKQSPAH